MNKDVLRLAVTLSAVWLAFGAAPALAKPRILSGTVAYRERIVLPPSAVVEVKLVDVSLADAPSKTLAQTSVRPGRQVPIAYRLRYDDAKIKPGRRYALQARIMVNDQLMFITATHHPVFAEGPDQTNIIVERVNTNADAAPPMSPAGQRTRQRAGNDGLPVPALSLVAPAVH